MKPDPSPMTPAWLRRLTGPLAAGLVLVLFWALLVASVRDKSVTYDETVHATAGYTYWKSNDYRMNPENGNLPQRWAALGLLGAGTKFPPADAPGWLATDEWELGDHWFNRMGNDISSLLLHGRAGSAVLAVALAALVWFWSRRIFGPVGGMLSLLLCVLNPSILANGPLMTSDTAAALFFLGAIGAWWLLLQRLSPGRLVLSALTMGGLFVAKMSAPLIIPMALVLVVVRLLRREPLPVGGKNPRLLVRRRQQAAALGVAALVHVAVVYATVWGFYGFRFSMFAPGQPGAENRAAMWQSLVGQKSLPEAFGELGLDSAAKAKAREIFDTRIVANIGWNEASDRGLADLKQTVLSPADATRLDAAIAAAAPTGTARAVLALRDRELLPESYLFGYLHAWRFAQARIAFFKGNFSSYGWVSFFPYTFLVKTPLATLAVAVLAVAALFAAGRRPLVAGVAPPTRGDLLLATAPLWTLFLLYWVAVLNSSLNIGHRHILATYPPFLVLCGGAGRWIEEWFASGRAGRTIRILGWTVLTLPVLQAGEIALRFPHYLAYFNGIVSPAEAYRQFTDSTLDWGQDLPGVKHYLEEHPAAGPFFLSYFGNGDPRTYGIKARLLPSNPGRFLREAPPLALVPLPAAGGRNAAEDIARQSPGYDLIGTTTQGNETRALFVKSPASLRLTAGTYFISASNLPSIWDDGAEQAYRRAREYMQPLLTEGGDPRARVQALTQLELPQWIAVIENFEKLQLLRLTAFLRARGPDDNIGYSILVYHLTAADITQALDGPARIER